MSIAKRWKVLSGSNNWQNLLNPLDRDLQKVLLHYGSYSSGTYDAFNWNTASADAGDCKYRPNDILQKLGLTKGTQFQYECVKFIYASTSSTPGGGGGGGGGAKPPPFIVPSIDPNARIKGSNWMGFICVSTDQGTKALGRRDILIAWRGTIKTDEWLKDFDATLTPANRILGKNTRPANVHRGFLDLYTNVNSQSTYNSKASARDQALGEVTKQLARFSKEEVSITVAGHSLGAALSTLNVVDIVANNVNKGRMVTAFNMGNPRVGDNSFKSVVDSLGREGLHILRVVNKPDVITQVPPKGLFSDVGAELDVDSRKSDFLNPFGNVLMYHLPEPGYMHPLATANVKSSEMVNGARSIRDIFLVNKSSDSLKPQYLVPSSWWGERHKGVVQQNDGSWQWNEHE